MIKLPRVIDSNGKEIKRLHPIAESINEKIVPLSYATLQVMKDEAVDERSYVELYTINGFSGIYRTRAPQKDIVGDTVTLQLEHAISEVGDWLIQDAYDEEITVRNAFVKVFSHYRGNKWQLGSFTATETVHMDVDYDNILETMIGIVQQQPKYYMTFNFGTTPWTVSLAQKSNTISAEGRLSRNISNVIVKRDDKDLCTRVYVKGLPKPAGRADDENAIGYMDADTQALYGIVEAQTGGTDLTLEQATRVAENYLALHKHPKISAEVEGYDFFYATGETIDKVEIAKKYRLTIPSKSVIVEDYITAINWRDVYNNPESVSIIVGDEQDPVMDFYKAQNSSSKSSRRSSKKQAKKNESFDQQFEITDQYGSILNQAGMHLDAYGMIVYARDNVNNIGSIIDQTASYIMTKVDAGDNDLHSEILQTQSMIRSAVWTANSEVFSYVDQTATYIQSVVEDTKNDLHSEVLQTQTMIRSAVWTANSEIISYIDQTSTYIINVVEDTKNDIGSAILQTASQIRSEVHAANSNLYSYVDQTATYIESVVADTANDLGSAILQTASQIRSELHANDSALFSYVDQTATHIESVVASAESKLGSAILQTASQIRSELHANDSVLFSYVDQTATYIQSAVASTASGLGSSILQTASQIRSEIHANDSALFSYVDQTATYIESVVSSTASGLGSAILQTASQIRSEVHAANSSVYSYVDQTATYIIDHIAQRAGTKIYTSLEEPGATDIQEGDYWMESSLIGFWDDDQNLPWNDTSKEFDWAQLSGSKLYVRENGAWKLVTDDTTLVEQTQLTRESDRVTALAGNFVYDNETWKYNIGMLNVRADEISSSVIQVDEKTNELGSNIVQTATEIRSEVYAANSQLYSSITQTATSIMTHVANVQSGLSSTILQTASEIRSEVSNTISGVQSTISQQANKIALVVDGNGIKAAQIVASINDSGSSVLLDADKVKISGTTTINDAFTVISGAVGVSVPLICSGNVNIDSNKVLNLYTATFQGSNPVSLNALTLANCIKSASVSGDTLTLTPFIGEAITFKKAAPTHSPTATLPASASSEPPSQQFDLLGTISVGEKINNWFTQTAKCEGGSSKLYKLNVDATGAYNKGRDSVTHSPSIDSVWTSSSKPSGGTQLNSLKTQYENAKDDGDFFCVRVDCNGAKKTYYCEP